MIQKVCTSFARIQYLNITEIFSLDHIYGGMIKNKIILAYKSGPLNQSKHKLLLGFLAAVPNINKFLYFQSIENGKARR